MIGHYPNLVSSVVLTFENSSAFPVSERVEYGSLTDGRWQIAIPYLSYVSPEFHRLFGDFNGDRAIDGGTDFANFGTTFGLSSGDPGYLAAFDFNNDNTVEGGPDYSEFGARFGLSL